MATDLAAPRLAESLPKDLVASVVHQARVIQEASGNVYRLPTPECSERGCDAETFLSA